MMPPQKMRILLLLLLCAGASGLRDSVHRTDENKNWVDAQAHCRRHHKDLLTIRDEAENDLITDSGWIGLNRQTLTSDWEWSSGRVVSYVTWASNELDFIQNCGFKMADDEGWYSEHCFEARPFYCEDEPLVLLEEMKPWEEALEYCRHLTQYHPTLYKNHRYHLASPLTANNTEYVFKGTHEKVWIELRFLGSQ